MSDRGGAELGPTNKTFGLPGPSDAETREDEIIRKAALPTRPCRYCEKMFTARKETQRFHDSRCSQLYVQGRIADETFTRWTEQMRELQDRWLPGDDEEERESKGLMVGYTRETDILQYDKARRKLYITIAEIQKRAPRAHPQDAARAYKLLSDELLRLWTLPPTVDLFRPYFAQTERIDSIMMEQTELPCRGLEGLAIVAKAWTERFTNTLNHGRPPGDLVYLDL